MLHRMMAAVLFSRFLFAAMDNLVSRENVMRSDLMATGTAGRADATYGTRAQRVAMKAVAGGGAEKAQAVWYTTMPDAVSGNSGTSNPAFPYGQMTGTASATWTNVESYHGQTYTTPGSRTGLSRNDSTVTMAAGVTAGFKIGDFVNLGGTFTTTFSAAVSSTLGITRTVPPNTHVYPLMVEHHLRKYYLVEHWASSGFAGDTEQSLDDASTASAQGEWSEAQAINDYSQWTGHYEGSRPDKGGD